MLDDSKGINFNTPVYADTFRRNWEFEQYGDQNHYWLELDYYVMRDAWEATRKPYGTALDFHIKAANGKPIFRDIGEAELETLSSRGFRLINATKTVASNNEAVYKVTELYGYAPDMTFKKYTTETIPRFGTEDPAGAVKETVQRPGNTYDASWDRYTIKLGANAAKFRAGDIVTLNGMPAIPDWSNIAGKPVAIYKVNETTVELPDFQPTFTKSGTSLTTSQMLKALNWTDLGWWYGTLTLSRAFSSRAPGNVKAVLRNEISYHYEVPELEERDVPIDTTGLEVDVINALTTPNIETWKEMVANREEIIAVDPELESVYTMYKKTVKYTRCR